MVYSYISPPPPLVPQFIAARMRGEKISAAPPNFLPSAEFSAKKNKNNTIPAKAGISAPQGAHFRKIRAQSIALTRDEIPAFAGMGYSYIFPLVPQFIAAQMRGERGVPQ